MLSLLVLIPAFFLTIVNTSFTPSVYNAHIPQAFVNSAGNVVSLVIVFIGPNAVMNQPWLTHNTTSILTLVKSIPPF